jgi:enediyne biosynthesis protein E4
LSDQEAGLAIPHPQYDWDEGHMTQAVFDFDNDGWLDILQGASDYPDNRALLYHQLSPLRFEEVPKELGIDHHRSHGIVFADFDRDGDLDVAIGTSLARCGYSGDSAPCYANGQLHIFENVIGNQNHWLQLRLEGGFGTNRAAIGARVTVKACGFTQTQEVGGGFGHYGAQNDLVLHFGLGASEEAEVTIRWPNAGLTRQSFTVNANQRYHVVQNEDPVTDGI